MCIHFAREYRLLIRLLTELRLYQNWHELELSFVVARETWGQRLDTLQGARMRIIRTRAVWGGVICNPFIVSVVELRVIFGGYGPRF